MRQAFKAARVFDGRDMVGTATVVVKDGLIEAVEHGEVPDAVDLGDVTLLPGLIDTHVHLAFDANAYPLVLESFTEHDDDALRVRIRGNAATQLAAGVTTVRDLGDRSFLAAELDSPLTVVASGPPLTVPQGHCWFLGGEVDGRDQVLAALEERVARGCTWVKVMVSGGNITPGNSPFVPQFRNPFLKEIVDEAHRLGLQAAGHVHAPVSVVDALDAGFDSLEHVSFMTEDGIGSTPEVLQRLVDSQVVVSTTMGALPGMEPPPFIQSRLEKVMADASWIASSGGRVVVGTDAGVGQGKPHGVLPHAMRDLAHGLDPIASLRALTSAAAEGIGLAGRKGVLAPGADADLLAVQGDPSVTGEDLLRVVGVWTKGEAVHR